MRVTRRVLDIEQILTYAGSLVQGDRPCRTSGPGVVHASDIYSELNEIVNPPKPLGKRDLNVYRLFGFVFERIMAQVYQAMDPARYQVLGEWRHDGITCSPDILDMQERRVLDCKATWKTLAKLDTLEKDFFAWVTQNKAYCKPIGWVAGGLVIFFVNGDYKDSGPVMVELALEYTQQEIDENWSMMVNHAKNRGWL